VTVVAAPFEFAASIAAIRASALHATGRIVAAALGAVKAAVSNTAANKHVLNVLMRAASRLSEKRCADFGTRPVRSGEILVTSAI
jgi:hypothetical protein